MVAVSTLGRGVEKNAGLVSAAVAMDELIESTGVHYRSLNPPGFMENLLSQIDAITGHGTFFGTMPGDFKVPTCATRDIAAVAARFLLDDSWTGQEGVPLLGPADLSPNDQAHIMSDVLGRPIQYQRVPIEDHRATLLGYGMSEAHVQGLTDMFIATERGLYNAEPRTPQSSTPTTFRQWCQEVLKPAINS